MDDTIGIDSIEQVNNDGGTNLDLGDIDLEVDTAPLAQ